MSDAVALPQDLRARLIEAQVSVLVDRAPDWCSLVLLACDVLSAGIESPAAAELSCLNVSAVRSDCEAPFLRMIAEVGLPAVPDHPRVLEHFVDEGDFASLLAIKSIPEIASPWLSSRRRPTPGDSEDHNWWATLLWMSQEWFDGAWPQHELALETIRQADSDRQLRQIGASILEALICDTEPVLRWVEEQAAESDKFRTALAGVWVYTQLTPPSFDRVERAAGVPLANPDR